MEFSELFAVAIDFEQSHLFFPRIVHWTLGALLLSILWFVGRPYLKAVKAGAKSLPFAGADFDHLRFFGTIVLTVLYFLSMERVGRHFPNTGLGFLIMSMPYMFLLSLLFLHQRDARHLALIAVNAAVAPLLAWYILAQLFGITLP